MPRYHVYNSWTGNATTVKAKNETAARRKGRKLMHSHKGIVRAYLMK